MWACGLPGMARACGVESHGRCVIDPVTMSYAQLLEAYQALQAHVASCNGLRLLKAVSPETLCHCRGPARHPTHPAGGATVHP
jgi:hypothetical protein